MIGSDGSQLGIMSAAQANALAEEQELDLVKISPNAVPPCLQDHGLFQVLLRSEEAGEGSPEESAGRGDQRGPYEPPSIDTNDFNTKVKSAQKFLKDGNRVKVSVRFRGREMAHTNLGEKAAGPRG